MRRDLSFTAQRGRRARQRLIFATILIVILFILDALFGGPLRLALQSGAATVWKVTASARNAITGSGYFTSHRTLAQQNETLEEQLAASQSDAAAYQGLKEENDELRAFLHLASSTPGLTAPIVSSFRASPYGTFMIGAGTADGVVPGSIVMSTEDFAIGTVTSAEVHTALVTGSFASGSSIDVLIGTTAAVANGRGGGNAIAMVPREASIHENDAVVAPSLGSHQIGIVGHVDDSASSAEQTVYIQLPINLSSLRYVYIIPKP